MRQLGRLDVSVNGGKRGKQNADGDPSHKSIKTPKKGEINYLPDFPEGMDEDSLEAAREVMVGEMMKTKPDDFLIKKNMDATFALRRKEVVQDKPDIGQLIRRWPALFTESQVCVIPDITFTPLLPFDVIINGSFFVPNWSSLNFRSFWSLTELLEETLRKPSLVPLMVCAQA